MDKDWERTEEKREEINTRHERVCGEDLTPLFNHLQEYLIDPILSPLLIVFPSWEKVTICRNTSCRQELFTQGVFLL